MEFQPPQTAVEVPEPANPTRFGVWGPFATMVWSVLVAIVFVVTQVLIVIAYLVSTKAKPANPEAAHALAADLIHDGVLLSFCTFATFLVCVPLILVLVKLKPGSNLKDYLALRLPSLKQLLVWSLISYGFCLLSDGISILLHRPVVTEFMLKAYGTASPRWMLWLALVVAAPVLEEVGFRGFMFKGLAASRLRWQGATIITAALWALIHVQYDWYSIFQIFALGLLFGVVRTVTNSTLLTIWLHCLVNVSATLQAAFALRQM